MILGMLHISIFFLIKKYNGAQDQIFGTARQAGK
jgi:hypothetical protein